MKGYKTSMMKKYLVVPIIVLLVFVNHASAQWNTIRNGVSWKDTKGNDVQAHAAGFLKVDDTWYMIGEDRTDPFHPDVNMYSSTDLVTWKFEGKIIENGVTHPDLGTSRFIERAKLLRCPSTGQFVIWCHWESADYKAAEAAVFYSDEVTGPYTFHWAGRPDNLESRDCNVFVDDDGTGYFISTINQNQDLGLFRLSDDYLSVTEHTVLMNGSRREAPAIVKIDDTYFMICSGTTGWDPNQAQMSKSTSLTGGWTALRDIGNTIAFDTQAANVLTIQGTEKTSYLYVGDRWIDPDLPESKTIIFPISFNNGLVQFSYSREFDVDFETGQTRTTPRSNFISKENWTVQYVSSEETSAEDGKAANAIDGNKNTIWHSQWSNGNVATYPHELQIDMGESHEITGFVCVPRNDLEASGVVRDYQLFVSEDGENWGQPVAGGWMLYNTEVTFQPVTGRYFRFVALSGLSGLDVAAVSEFELVQNSTYNPIEVKAYSKLNNASWSEADLIAVEPGDVLTFNPQSAVSGGSWSWHGPNDVVSSSRELSIENIQEENIGTYTLMYSDKFGGITRKIIEVKLGMATGMPNDTHGYIDKVNIYPNPVRNVLHVETHVNSTETFDLFIYDCNGRLRKSGVVMQNVQTIDVSNLASGTYFLKLVDKKEAIFRKFIKS